MAKEKPPEGGQKEKGRRIARLHCPNLLRVPRGAYLRDGLRGVPCAALG